MAKRMKRIELRVSEDEKRAIELEANKQGMTVSSYIRFVAYRAANAVFLPASPEVIHGLRNQ